MKHLFRILFVLAVLCGGSSIAHATGIDFRMTVLDPPNGCLQGDSSCAVYNPGTPLSVAISADECGPFGLTGPQGMYGCLVINNLTGSTINSLSLTFFGDPLGNQDASCDSLGQNGLPSVLNVVSCGEVNGNYQLDFAGGTGVANGSDLVVFEEGADPSLFEGGSASVGVTPEPDSLLLFSTGVMMAGLYMSRRVWTTVRKSSDGNR
jgi:hypothetical protein